MICAAGPGVTLRQQFDRKVLNADGTESARFMINEEFIASLDYLVATCLWPSIVEARSQSVYYQQRVLYYKHFDGKEGKRNWRTDLLNCLTDWKVRFPQVVRNRRSILEDSPAQERGPGSGEKGGSIPEGWI